MKHLQKLNISTTEPLLKSKKDYLEFTKVWNTILTEDRESGKSKSTEAPLTILRNLMLGKSPYNGFTPVSNPKSLANGRSFISGFAKAALLLRATLDPTKQWPTELGVRVFRLLQTSSIYRNIRTAHTGKYSKGPIIQLPKFEEFLTCVASNDDGICSRAQKVLIESTKKYGNEFLTFDELFDEVVNNHRYFLIPKEDALNFQGTEVKFRSIIHRLWTVWMCRNNIKKSYSTTIEMARDPEWFYDDPNDLPNFNDGESLLIPSIYTINDNIRVTLLRRDMWGDKNPTKEVYLIPISYLWDTQWLEDVEDEKAC